MGGINSMHVCVRWVRGEGCMHERPPHLPLLMLGDQVAVEVLQGHLSHGHPLLGVVTHRGAGGMAPRRHGYLT